ncbi:MAG: MarR family transcriptional regulator [Burkholderiaceae bacterium]
MARTSRQAAFYKPDKLDPRESIAVLSKHVLHSVGQQVDRRLAGHDLSHAQWLPLYRLWRSGGRSTPNELARELQMDPGAVTRALDRLELKRLVRRARSTDDRRVVHLELTPEGEALVQVVPPILAEVMNAHLAGFTRSEWRLLVELLQRVVANGQALAAVAEGKA